MTVAAIGFVVSCGGVGGGGGGRGEKTSGGSCIYTDRYLY